MKRYPPTELKQKREKERGRFAILQGAGWVSTLFGWMCFVLILVEQTLETLFAEPLANADFDLVCMLESCAYCFRWIAVSVAAGTLLSAVSLLIDVALNHFAGGSHSWRMDLANRSPGRGLRRLMNATQFQQLVLLGMFIGSTRICAAFVLTGVTLGALSMGFLGGTQVSIQVMILGLLAILLSFELCAYAIRRWDWCQSMRMDEHEIREELKEQEVSPMLRMAVRDARGL